MLLQLEIMLVQVIKVNILLLLVKKQVNLHKDLILLLLEIQQDNIHKDNMQ